MKFVFCGTLVHSTPERVMEVLHDRIMGIDLNGKIAFLENRSKLHELAQKFGFETKDVINLKPRSQFLIPGFVDTHIHAPQYVFTGTGYDVPLLQWLEKYTFPVESNFKCTKYAEHAYKKVVARLLKNGTTTASYFASIHLEATNVLCDVVAELGQRGYIGKVSMDQNSPDYYVETTQKAIEDAERFVKHALELKNALITPVVTPRFVLSCTTHLLKQLGDVAMKYDVPIQSHLNETKNEIQMVKKRFSDDTYTAVYDKHNLLNSKTYMAHCCHSSEEELCLMVKKSSGVAHCPTSNFNIRSGIADVRAMLDKKIKVGLGTDVSGGESTSILVAIRDCIKASNVLSLRKPEEYKPLNFEEAFFLATLGGSQVLGLDGKIGNFEVGKDFDALLIDVEAQNSAFDCFDRDNTMDVIQKFLMLGDDRNILKVFVAGRVVCGQD
ncbi:Guanine deaminase [Acropora cervicornis]|uniref:Guanine deaminase n=1 Tax=Acropora cervicornis TaxID=6130 RepID=A0AAD9QQ77_ACRCE|nr:Guanine deaminase [Acropora cervicornis]